MNIKVFVVFCCTVACATKANSALTTSQYTLLTQALNILGMSIKDASDYNKFITGLENVIEQTQQVAVKSIEETVTLAQGVAKAIAVLGAQQNVKDINNIQNGYIKAFEDTRQKAFNQSIDVSSCVSSSVQRMHAESEKSAEEIGAKMTDITNIFNNYTIVTYVQPAKHNLEIVYSIRERIYKCPFNFTDFQPFYLCLSVGAVLDDIVLLNNFIHNFNDTSSKVYDLVTDFYDDSKQFRQDNINAFNATAQNLYVNDFVPCAAKQGIIV